MSELRISNASWPETPVPDSLKQLMGYYLSLLDTNTPDAGAKLASEIFTPDAIFGTSSATFKGSKEIQESRTQAWTVVDKRFHEIIRVYAFKNDASELLTIGSAVLNLKNGKEVKGDFIARWVLEGVDSGKPKISYFQVWGDTGPMLKALQE